MFPAKIPPHALAATEFVVAGKTVATDCLIPDRPSALAYDDAQFEADRRLGHIIGNYRIACRLGAGSMGIVFKAVHVRMGRTVAIKVATVSREMSPRRFQRFLDEAHALAQLQHPHIVFAIDDGDIPADHGALAGCHYFVMEYVDGEDLDVLVSSRGPLSVEETCAIGRQIAGALGAANKLGLVHRDIKPANIRVAPDGQNAFHAKLLDFGLVRRPSSTLTEPGSLLGTIEYMAPEQLKNASAVDIRSDIFGLGATLFWCLTGAAPFPATGTIHDVLMRRTTQSPPSVRDHVPAIPEKIDAILSRMMATDPANRYATPDEVIEALG